jgi:hypothetical protein
MPGADENVPGITIEAARNAAAARRQRRRALCRYLVLFVMQPIDSVRREENLRPHA